MEGIILSHLPEFVKNKEVLAHPQADDKWGIMPYDVEGIQGEALITAQDGFPEDLVIAPRLTGWHKIFICGWKMGGGYEYLVKLDNEPHFHFHNYTGLPGKSHWSGLEHVEEQFWCCADLTDRDIIFRKPRGYTLELPETLVWLRCVPMTDEEVAAQKEYDNPVRNLHAHFDSDTNLWYGTKTDEAVIHKLYNLKNTDVKICTLEAGEAMDTYTTDRSIARLITRQSKRYALENANVAARMAEIAKVRGDLLHSFGIQMYGGLRTSVAVNSDGGAVIPFVLEHPEFHLTTRDGRKTLIASYAFPETRQFVVDYLKYLVSIGFDGVTLIMHRGMHIAFEQPVLDEFAKRHGGLDARRVPMDDPRLKDVWCYFMAEFFRTLRRELNESAGRHVPINVVTAYNNEASRRIGVDIALLAKEGLIDSICQDSMETMEVFPGCLAEDGLIDLEKYKEYLRTDYTVKRRFHENWDLTKAGAEEYIAMTEKYGVEFYGGMPPWGVSTTQKYVDWVNNLKAIGVKNFSFVNFCHNVQDKAKYHAITKTGHDTVNMKYCTVRHYRVLSMDGVDMSTYQPAWRG